MVITVAYSRFYMVCISFSSYINHKLKLMRIKHAFNRLSDLFFPFIIILIIGTDIFSDKKNQKTTCLNFCLYKFLRKCVAKVNVISHLQILFLMCQINNKCLTRKTVGGFKIGVRKPDMNKLPVA